MIEGVIITNLPQHIDSRGAVFKYLSSNSSNFKLFGEAYFSKINKGVIKGWKLHKIANQNFTVPYGKVQIVLYDDREGSATRGNIEVFVLDDSENYKLLTLPNKIWYSFKSIANNFSILANISDTLHDPVESINQDLSSNEIPYDWE